MYGQFAMGLERILIARNALEIIDRRRGFSDYRDYMNYLDARQLKLLIGSKYVLANKNYALTREFEEFTRDRDVIYTVLMRNGLALKKGSMKVCIHSIEAEIRPQNLSDERPNYDERTGLYTYSIYSGMPIDFQESDLETFLYYDRRVVKILAKVSVRVGEEGIGCLVVE